MFRRFRYRLTLSLLLWLEIAFIGFELRLFLRPFMPFCNKCVKLVWTRLLTLHISSASVIFSIAEFLRAYYTDLLV